MPQFQQHVTLGRSGLSVGRLGVSGGYGVGTAALRRAFDAGVTYFYHGSKRAPGMATAIREIAAAGGRDRLVVLLQSYTRFPAFLERSLARGLARLGLEHADVLLLGWFNAPPSERLFERAERLRERGMFRKLAISGHRRAAFPAFAADSRVDVLHLRYNAAHAGAEADVFPLLPATGRPGTVAYTATRWGQLLDPRRMPRGEQPLRGRDAYRFVLSNPNVDVCMCGPRDDAQMDEALAALAAGPLAPDEDARIRAIGQHVRSRSLLR